MRNKLPKDAPVKVGPGYILLTSGVGGSSANWKDRFISKAIVLCQRVQMLGERPDYSHAELCIDNRGMTFAARWRTKKYKNGLADYIGSKVLIGRPVPEFEMIEFKRSFYLAGLDKLDGRLYPLPRIFLAGFTAFILPKWFIKLNIFKRWAMCSEVVARLFSVDKKRFRFTESGWKGIFPGHLEQVVRNDDAFEVVFEGVLTEELMQESGLSCNR